MYALTYSNKYIYFHGAVNFWFSGHKMSIDGLAIILDEPQTGQKHIRGKALPTGNTIKAKQTEHEHSIYF
jgi:hypothetical protein